MRTSTLILFSLFYLSSESTPNNSTSKCFDNDTNATTIDKIKLSNKTPEITKLPFGPKISSSKSLCNVSNSFYFNLIGQNFSIESGFKKLTTSYQLPTIKKYFYTIVDTNIERSRCNNNIPIDSLIKITSYKVRLPDYESFEVYYMSNCADNGDDLSKTFKNSCESFYYKFYGILILYDKSSKTARLLPVFYEQYSESVHTRHFYIDKNYKIFLCNKTFSEGDNAVDKTSGPVYEVTIKKDGNFVVKKTSDEK